MLLYLNILALLLLQLDLSRTMPLTTPSRECPTCDTKPTQTQATEYLNATLLSIGEACGVYTLNCAQGLRCAPPQGELRPLRALLEGRGVCSNASGINPTENTQIAGKSRTCQLDDVNEFGGVTVADHVYKHHLLCCFHFRFNDVPLSLFTFFLF